MNESFIADDQLLVTPEEAARRLSVDERPSTS